MESAALSEHMLVRGLGAPREQLRDQPHAHVILLAPALGELTSTTCIWVYFAIAPKAKRRRTEGGPGDLKCRLKAGRSAEGSPGPRSHERQCLLFVPRERSLTLSLNESSVQWSMSTTDMALIGRTHMADGTRGALVSSPKAQCFDRYQAGQRAGGPAERAVEVLHDA